MSVVVPVFDEARTVVPVVREVLAQAPVREVVVVDDGSGDGSHESLRELAREDARLRVLRHERNRGKGAALRTGFACASSAIVLVQDADAEYDPSDIRRVVEPIRSGAADVVYGTRFHAAGASARWHELGNALLTRLSNRLARMDLTDMETGTKAFRRELLEQILIEENRFGVEPELTAKLSRIPGVRVREVPVRYAPRGYDAGKKIGWRDGFDALRCILKYNLAAR